MADRYQDRAFPAEHDFGGEHDHGVPQGKAESDPLAELARLIGQTDPFSKTPHPLQSRANVRPAAYQPPEQEFAPPSPPPWMQRARQEAPPPQEPEYVEPELAEQEELQPSAVHPLHRYAAQHPEPAPEPEYREDLPFPEAGQEPDPSRYDDALYGKIESGEQDFQRDPAYPDDPYAYQSDYEEDEPAPRKRSSGLMTVAAVLALAVVGTGGALAYRTYVGSPRTGEPPIIKADNSPTKVMAAPADGVAKTPDRMVTADGGEKLVSREETPVDVNSKVGGPRVVFPPLNQNANPPTVASVTPQAALPPAAPSGTLSSTEPRKVSTLRVKGDAADAGVPAGAAPPPAKPAPVARAAAANPAPARGNPSAANASANAPLSLAPGGAPADPSPAPTRVASTNPAPAVSGGSGWLVQVSSQKSEADAQASYRALQGKYPAVLGSQSSTVKRVDLTDKGHGIVYRAFAGPFGSVDQATQVCNSLKAAGGPLCLIQRN